MIKKKTNKIKVGLAILILKFVFPVVLTFVLIMGMFTFGGEDGKGGNPHDKNGGGVITGELGFPYADKTVTMTQGFWTNPSEAVEWWGNITPPYSSGCHPAIDYSSGLGTQILSVSNGKVVSLYENDSFGKHVIVESVLGEQTIYILYAHFSQFSVADNATVQQGDILGYEGKTGISTGSHLHLEIGSSYESGNLTENRCERINYLDLYKG